jgi:hypothetical protein
MSQKMGFDWVAEFDQTPRAQVTMSNSLQIYEKQGFGGTSGFGPKVH